MLAWYYSVVNFMFYGTPNVMVTRDVTCLTLAWELTHIPQRPPLTIYIGAASAGFGLYPSVTSQCLVCIVASFWTVECLDAMVEWTSNL